MIHPTAIVSPKAEIDSSVEVGPHVIIEEHVRVCAGTTIMANAYLAGHTQIGRDNRIHMGAVIGHEPQDTHFKKDTRSFLIIGDRNIFREYCNVHRGTQPESATLIGHDNFIMATAHVGHNCEIGNHVVICNCALLAGYVTVGDRAFVSGGVVIHQFTKVGRLAMFSGNARVSMDVPPFMIAAERNEVHAVNLVGVKRANLSSEAVREIKKLFKLFYRSELKTSAALEQAGSFQTPEAREFLDFVRTSPNGICPAARGN